MSSAHILFHLLICTRSLLLFPIVNSSNLEKEISFFSTKYLYELFICAHEMIEKHLMEENDDDNNFLRNMIFFIIQQQAETKNVFLIICEKM